jgi:hypothetical protein
MCDEWRSRSTSIRTLVNARESEIRATVEAGERIPARFGRTAFRRNCVFDGVWRGKRYGTKQVEAVAIEESGRWLVITVLVKYF